MDVRIKQGDIIFFINALSDYVSAKIEYETNRSEWKTTDDLLKTGNSLEQAIERLIAKL